MSLAHVILRNPARSWSGRTIRVFHRVSWRYSRVIQEAAAAFWADDGGESSRFGRGESVHDDLIDPVGVVTRTAAILDPFSGKIVEGPKLVHYRVRHIVAPRLFPRIIRTL